MARKKKQEDPGAGSPWITTFADLMNLLLCFFVLLFSMSNTDTEKIQQFAQSASGGFSIFSGGGSAFQDGVLISTGITQVNDIKDLADKSDDNTDKGEEGTESADTTYNDYMNAYIADKKQASETLYDQLSDLAERNNVNDNIEMSIDPDFQFVKLSLNGSILFDSGKAELKKESIPVFSKVGDILRKYKGYKIEVEGHTDNRPISTSSYPNNNWLSSARAINTAMYLINEKGLDPNTLSWTGRGEYDPIASNDTAEGRQKNRRIEIKIYSEINK